MPFRVLTFRLRGELSGTSRTLRQTFTLKRNFKTLKGIYIIIKDDKSPATIYTLS